jgi:hypothetical protein
MSPELLAKLRDTFELLQGQCTTLDALIEKELGAAEESGDEEYDYFGANDAQEYLANIKEQAAESLGQWWANPA